MGRQFIKFRESQVCKSISPSLEVISSIDLLETGLFIEGLIDEAVETMLLSSYHITYKKDGKNVFMIRPFKSDWNIKIFGTHWNLQPLFQLPVTFEFEIENTGWRMHGMMDAKEEVIFEAFRKAFMPTPMEQLLFYPLSVIQAYFVKNSFLFQTADEQTLQQVVLSFWEGNITRISQLSLESANREKNNVSEFLNQWYSRLMANQNLKENQIHDRMKVNKEGFLSILSSLHTYMKNSFTNYRNSLLQLWHDSKLLNNHETFHTEVEKIRETIVWTEMLLDDLEQLNPFVVTEDTLDKRQLEILEPETKPMVSEEKKQKSENVEPVMAKKEVPTRYPINRVTPNLNTAVKEKNKIADETNDWFEFIIKTGGAVRNMPFRTKKDLFGEDSIISLSIHEYRVDMLAKQLAKEKRMAVEIKRMIKLLVQNSNAQGYVTKEELKTLFMQEYKDLTNLNDYAMRYGVKKHLAHQAISTKFHVVFELLRKQGLIKEYLRNDAFQVFWNFAVYVHQ